MKTIGLFGLFCLAAATQTTADVPLLIRVQRTPGIGTASAVPYAEAKVGVPVLGMTALTGLSETWLMETHASFESIEQVDAALWRAGTRHVEALAAGLSPDEILSVSRSWIALYRPWLSYRVDEAMQGLPLAHYFEISLYRIQPGREGDFGDFIAARKTAKDSVNMDRPEIGYQVISGAPPQTFIFLAPLHSLSSLDDVLPRLPIYARPAAKAAGKIAAEAEFRSEEMLFRVAPDLSYVSDEFSAADRGFWRGSQ